MILFIWFYTCLFDFLTIKLMINFPIPPNTFSIMSLASDFSKLFDNMSRQLKRLTFCDPYVFLKRFYEIQANIETHVWQTSCVYYTQTMKKCNNIVINALYLPGLLSLVWILRFAAN